MSSGGTFYFYFTWAFPFHATLYFGAFQECTFSSNDILLLNCVIGSYAGQTSISSHFKMCDTDTFLFKPRNIVIHDKKYCKKLSFDHIHEIHTCTLIIQWILIAEGTNKCLVLLY